MSRSTSRPRLPTLSPGPKALLWAAALLAVAALESYLISQSPTRTDEGDIFVVLAFFGGFAVLLGAGAAFVIGFMRRTPLVVRVPALVAAVGAGAVFAASVYVHTQDAFTNDAIRARFADFQAPLPSAVASGEPSVGDKVVILAGGGYDLLNGQDVVEVEPGAVANMTFKLPAEMRASTPQEVDTVVWLSCDRTTTGTYESGADATRYDCGVTVADPVAGTAAKAVSFSGGEPPDVISCSGSCPAEVHGALPFNAILDYLSTLPRR